MLGKDWGRLMMLNIESIETEIFEINEIEIFSPKETGPWREFDRISAVAWKTQIFHRRKKSPHYSYIPPKNDGHILNISVNGIACEFDSANEIHCGDRLKLQFEILGRNMAIHKYRAIVEVVRPCRENICFSRFINIPRELTSIISREVEIQTKTF